MYKLREGPWVGDWHSGMEKGQVEGGRTDQQGTEVDVQEWCVGEGRDSAGHVECISLSPRRSQKVRQLHLS